MKMRIRGFLAVVALAATAAPLPLLAQQPAPITSPQALVTALYEAVSNAPGATHDWGRFRALFAPGARLIVRTPKGGLKVMTVEEFVAAFPDQEGSSFVETELASRMERYGHIAHAWSSYEGTHREGEKTTVLRGVNSFQMAETDGAWKVVTIFWESEASGGEVPADLR